MKKSPLILCFCVAGLYVMGALMLYSASYKEPASPRLYSHLIWVCFGGLTASFLSVADHRRLQRPWVLYALGSICILLLLVVFIPGIGVKVNGASRWIKGIGQPAEFAKPVVVALVAAWCARRSSEEMRDLKQGFIVPALLGFIPALLVFAEPDWGTSALLCMLALSLLVVAGARGVHVAITAVIGVTALAILIAHNPVRLTRILVFLDPEAHRFGAGWQVWQSLLAIGSGGWQGAFLDGSPHKFGFVPEEQTDFIFARIGEETGLWGASLTLLLYAGILQSGFRIMQRADERFSQLLAFGSVLAIVLQALINIAVATGMVPNKGLPLPFVSYGGSNMIAMSVCLGLLLNVARASNARQQPAHTPSGPEAKPAA
jgi:cell division protein FtsW